MPDLIKEKVMFPLTYIVISKKKNYRAEVSYFFASFVLFSKKKKKSSGGSPLFLQVSSRSPYKLKDKNSSQ